jgi:hypothetical protein
MNHQGHQVHQEGQKTKLGLCKTILTTESQRTQRKAIHFFELLILNHEFSYLVPFVPLAVKKGLVF